MTKSNGNTEQTNLSRRTLLGSAAAAGSMGTAAAILGGGLLGSASARADGGEGSNVYRAAYIFKRVPGMSLDEFLEHYEKVHGPLMINLMKGRGLISYEHYPVRPVGVGDDYVPEGGPAFDAISIYTFESGEAAHAAWNIPEVAEDSKRFIDFSTMVMMPLTKRTVFP